MTITEAQDAKEARRVILGLRREMEAMHLQFPTLIKLRDELSVSHETRFFGELYRGLDPAGARSIADDTIGKEFSAAFDAVNDARDRIKAAEIELAERELDYFVSGAYMDDDRYVSPPSIEPTRRTDQPRSRQRGVAANLYDWFMGRDGEAA